MIWPVPGYYAISSHFGEPHPGGLLHLGTDFPAPGVRTVAIGAGKIIFANWAGSAGRSVYLDMGAYRVHYCHLSAFNVTAGQAVRAGDVIGWVGGSGHGRDGCYGSHLHLNLFAAERPATGPSHWVGWVGMWAVDPELYLSKEDGMPLTPEQHEMLQTVHHMAKLETPARLADILTILGHFETREVARYEQLRRDIDAIRHRP